MNKEIGEIFRTVKSYFEFVETRGSVREREVATWLQLKLNDLEVEAKSHFGRKRFEKKASEE